MDAKAIESQLRWSPLTCLSPAPLSPSGLIILDSNNGEIETLVVTNVELRCEFKSYLKKVHFAGCYRLYRLTLIFPLFLIDDGSGTLPSLTAADTGGVPSWHARDANLSCHITTHRIVLLDEKYTIGGSIPLPLVQALRKGGGPSIRSPRSSYKIKLATHAWGELTIAFRGGASTSYSQSSKDRDDTLAAIERAMKRKAWQDKERNASKEENRPSNIIAARKVGVDAILTKNALRHKENSNLADVAFGGNNDQYGRKSNPMGVSVGMMKTDKSSKKEDIDAFLRDATELIKVIQKYAATIERDRATSSSSSSADVSSDSVRSDTEKLASMIESMGMTSALSKKQSGGSMYHRQLARQMVDYLRQTNMLTNAGGMMSLTDVYCLFNRARGTNLISPEDFLRCIDLMKELNLGVSKRSFPSGVMVIQDDAFDDVAMGKKLTELASSSLGRQKQTGTDNSEEFSCGGITTTDVCRSLNMTALLANEHLLSAEQSGWLCRDATIEGVRFFPNLFTTGEFSLCLPSAVK
jgi:ESCRT-II complex subunit VPS36